MAQKKSHMISQKRLERMVALVKAVAHPMRLQIVEILMNGEQSVGNLVKILGAKQSLTSQQLKILKYVGIVKPRREANVVFYFMGNDSVRKIMASILKENA